MMSSLRHPAREARLLASIVALLLALTMLGGCETTGLRGMGGSGEDRAERLAEKGEHAEAAGAYIALASEAVGIERDRLTLLAVEQWLDAGDVARARNGFNSVPRPAAGSLLAIWSTNSAALSLYAGAADEALGILEPMSRQPLSDRDRLRVEALRADAWIQKQDPKRAVQLMMQREAWISDRHGIELEPQALVARVACQQPPGTTPGGRDRNRPCHSWLALDRFARCIHGPAGCGLE